MTVSIPLRRFRLRLARAVICQDAGRTWVVQGELELDAIEAADALAEAYRLAPDLRATDVLEVVDLTPWRTS